MDTLLSLLVLSTLPQLAVPMTAELTPVLDLVEGESRIFSGESVRLRCSVPDPYNSTWGARWFHDNDQLPGSGATLTLSHASVKKSGKYYCQGIRDSVVGIIDTLKSLPVLINVDGGFAIMQAPSLPILVGEDLPLTCRVRRSSRVNRVILYKDGVEVKRQLNNPYLTLKNATLKDKGEYHCRVSWSVHGSTVEAISVKTSVMVQELMSKPILEIIANSNDAPVNMMKIVCHHEYNVRPPAPPVLYYFYKNHRRLGTAQSNNYELVKRNPGQYSCKAKVSSLNLDMLSDPKTF